MRLELRRVVHLDQSVFEVVFRIGSEFSSSALAGGDTYRQGLERSEVREEQRDPGVCLV